MRWPLQPLQPFQQTQLQPPFGQSVDSLCHPWFTTTNVSYRFPILKLPPPPCAVLLVYIYISNNIKLYYQATTMIPYNCFTRQGNSGPSWCTRSLFFSEGAWGAMHHKSHAAHRLLVQFRVVPGASSASYSRTTWVLCLLWHTMILCILCYVVVLRVEGNTINQP